MSSEQVKQACNISTLQQCCRSRLFSLGNEKDGPSVNRAWSYDRVCLENLFFWLPYIVILKIRIRNVNITNYDLGNFKSNQTNSNELNQIK